MNNYKLTIQYDGTRYSGWQKQGNTADTIQGKIETVLQKWLKEDIEIHGSGRTDAGVHALCQVAKFKTSAALSCPQIMTALNQYLPQDVRITSVTQVDPRFHARLNAKQKHYRYQIDNGSAAEVFERKYITRFADTDYFYKLCRQTGHLSATFGDSSVNTDISRPSERNNVASNNTMPPQIIYDLEAMQKMGRHPDRGDPERQRPAFFPGDRKHSGKQRLHLPAQSGVRRPAHPCGAIEHFPAAITVCGQFRTRRGAFDL